MSLRPLPYWRALLERELWEHRGGLLLTPLVAAGALFGLLLLGLLTTEFRIMVGEVNVASRGLLQGLARAQSPEAISQVWSGVWLALLSLFHVLLSMVLFFYCLGALYDDRRDRSILFWRSLPVAERDVVLAKLVIVFLLGPLVVLTGALMTYLLVLALTSVPVLLRDASAWTLVWQPGVLHARLLGGAMTLVVNQFWLAPLYGWLLFCSAFAKTRPFLWATVLPVLLVLGEAWLRFASGWGGESLLWQWLLERAMGLFFAGSALVSTGLPSATPPTVLHALRPLTHAEFWFGIVLAVAWIAGSIYFRRYRDDSTA